MTSINDNGAGKDRIEPVLRQLLTQAQTNKEIAVRNRDQEIADWDHDIAIWSDLLTGYHRRYNAGIPQGFDPAMMVADECANCHEQLGRSMPDDPWVHQVSGQPACAPGAANSSFAQSLSALPALPPGQLDTEPTS